MDRVPQVTESVALSARLPLEEMAALERTSARVREALGKEGRLIVRWSGTEPKLRLMVEGPDEEQIRGWAQELVAAAERDVPPVG
jgi:phosphoglucosamine mutase